MVGGEGNRTRFAIEPLDGEDPFEIDDGNRPHLYKHLAEDGRGRLVLVGPEDLLDVYLDETTRYFPGGEDGEADWLMVGSVPGLVLCVPLAPPRSGDWRKCRPIGVYKASNEDRLRFESGDTDG